MGDGTWRKQTAQKTTKNALTSIYFAGKKKSNPIKNAVTNISCKVGRGERRKQTQQKTHTLYKLL